MKHILTLAALVFATSCFGQESFFDTLSEAGFSLIYEGEQSSFYLSSTSTDWIDARAICQELGGDLASFSSEQESIQVGQLLPTHVLIGLYQDTSSSSYSEPSGGWVWTSGEALDWNLWQSTEQGTEPNNVNGGEDVAELFDGYYNDLPDNYAGYPFLLEISHGCMEENACNYDPEALWSDGSCDMVSCHCLEGTAWDESLEGCIPLVSAETACGEGTVWDTEAQHCVIANPSDTDFDGCVSMTDLLDLLSVFGTCNEVPWSCGDPLEYQGYDYETVLIGEQCWFAENLRAESYRDGDTISGNLSNDDWSTTLQGAVTFYNNAPSPLLEYGRLYNGYATQDPRGLCPQGWQIPSDDDWTVMTNLFGGLDSAGLAMKSLFGWSNDGGGNNSSGFDALPGGSRYNDGVFNGTTYDGYWWSSTLVESTAWFRQLENDKSEVIRQPSGLNYGFSVRCIKDSE